MKILLCCLVVFTNLFGPFPAAAEDAPKGLRIKIESLSGSGRISVQLENSSTKTIRVWQDHNSWGAARWRVLVLRRGQLQGFFQNPNRAYTRNGPGFIEILSGSYVAQTVDLNDGEWCGLGECSSQAQRGLEGKKISFESGDLVIVVYDVPLTGEAREMNVWYGVVAISATIK
jgi:hypothetical protein